MKSTLKRVSTALLCIVLVLTIIDTVKIYVEEV